jgi:hypothetical protein
MSTVNTGPGATSPKSQVAIHAKAYALVEPKFNYLSKASFFCARPSTASTFQGNNKHVRSVQEPINKGVFDE